MTMYWIYDLPNWLLGVGVVSVFMLVAVGGLLATRPLVRWLVNASGKYNDIVSYFFAGVGVFYGLALGLIAVATWQNFNQVDSLISREAAALSALYLDLDIYPQPLRDQTETALRAYTRHIIEVDWPAHRLGMTTETGNDLLENFENTVMGFEPTSERLKVGHAEVIHSLDEVEETHRLRLNAVTTGLPAALWAVVLVGALLTFTLTFLFWVDNLKLHIVLTALFAMFVGLLVFLTAAMDCPFRGDVSVSPDAIRDVLDHMVQAAGKK